MWILDELERLKNSNKLAIIHRENKITFKELWSRSEHIANYILSACKTKSPILIYGNKEIDIITVMVAVLKTGRAYCPIDVTYPQKRLYKIAEITNTELVFNFSDIELSGNFNIVDQYKIDEICLKKDDEISPIYWVKDEDICYILFTSGSTGEPKGVSINKKNLKNFISWFKAMCIISDSQQIVLNQVSYSFDVSDISIYIYLPMGKTLFNIDRDMLDNAKELFYYLKKSNISVWISTPAFLEICSFNESFNSDMLPNLEKFILAGEVLTKKLVKNINNKFKNSILINGYGPTEGTVLLTACKITDKMLNDDKTLPIGKILPDATYKIVGKNNEPVKYGNQGELVVISDSISMGYYNNPEQTNKVFFKAEDGRNGYFTGDLVFENNGLIYYVARKDFQIKLNGFRIELDDIANNLNKIEFINNSIVMPVYKSERVNYIIAFVTLNEKREETSFKLEIKIKNELKNFIPSYMVPKKIKILDSFPLNTNGKIDRKRLMEEI